MKGFMRHEPMSVYLKQEVELIKTRPQLRPYGQRVFLLGCTSAEPRSASSCNLKVKFKRAYNQINCLVIAERFKNDV